MRSVDLDIGFPLDLTLVLSSCFPEEKAIELSCLSPFPHSPICVKLLCLEAVQSSGLERHCTETIYLGLQLDEDDQEGRIHFQQDGAPPHYLGEVREYLNTRFPGRWIGREAPIAWPPRSPGLTPLDFFL
ncbi:hypothetical protein B7P43_G16983 [Cryptotermes secundus]|uniref:Uncharacterized protein n=1 Tax=Cryptotermes secundus TaxID=105785 RepID=A0A2J7PV29_9NEOP|nr:hypothetical protein B7P43_G16983 [Cryptotermes secundus]